MILNGSVSADDIGIVSYVWDFDSSDGLQQDAAGAVVQHSYSVTEVYPRTLAMEDVEDVIDSDAVIIT